MEASGYTLDLYCDNDLPIAYNGAPVPGKEHPWRAPGETAESFYGEKRAQCVRKARSRGWKFKRDGRHICGLCVKGGT